MVAMNVWPTDAADGSVANEARWRKMARQWLASGVIAGVGGQMAPSLAYPNLTIQPGAVWADGHYCELLGAQVLGVTANGLAVVRFDPAANTAELLYRDGVTTPAQDPAGTWEQPIAQLSGSVLVERRGTLLAPAGQAAAVLQGTVPGGTVALGTEATVANIPNVPVGRYMVFYNVLLTSTSPIKAQLKFFNNGVAQFNFSAAAPGTGASFNFAMVADVTTPNASLLVNLNNNQGGAAAVTCYPDLSNHRFAAMRGL